MVGKDYLRGEISHEEYIELRKLRAQDEYLQELRKIVWRDAAEVLKTPDGDLDKAVNQALELCELNGGVDAFLDSRRMQIESRHQD